MSLVCLWSHTIHAAMHHATGQCLHEIAGTNFLVLCAAELCAPSHCYCSQCMVDLVWWYNLSIVRSCCKVDFPLSHCRLCRSLVGMAAPPNTSDSGTPAPSDDGSSEVCKSSGVFSFLPHAIMQTSYTYLGCQITDNVIYLEPKSQPSIHSSCPRLLYTRGSLSTAYKSCQVTCKQLTKTLGLKRPAVDWLIVAYYSSVNFAIINTTMSLYSIISAVIAIANSFGQYTPKWLLCSKCISMWENRTHLEPQCQLEQCSELTCWWRRHCILFLLGNMSWLPVSCAATCSDVSFVYGYSGVVAGVLYNSTRTVQFTVMVKFATNWSTHYYTSKYIYKQGQIPKTSHRDANSPWWPVHHLSHLTFIITNFLYYITIDTHNCIVLDTKPNPLMKHCITSLVLFSVFSYRHTYVYAPVYAHVYVQTCLRMDGMYLQYVCLKTSWHVFSQEPVYNVCCIHSVIQVSML